MFRATSSSPDQAVVNHNGIVVENANGLNNSSTPPWSVRKIYDVQPYVSNMEGDVECNNNWMNPIN